MGGRRQLCLYMPYFPTDRARRDGLLPASHPLVLTCSAGSSVTVECVDAHAAQRGLRPGMSLAQAQAMVSELLVHPHQPRRDRQALRRLADWATGFSPLVEPHEPGTLLLDVTGCERLFRGEANLARQALDGLTEQGFAARAAVADTVGAAWALAYAGSQDLTISPPGQTSHYLAPLPPAALRLDPGVVARLESLGLRTIGDLLKLPRAALPARFGRQLVLRLQQAVGEVFEGVAVRQTTLPPHARHVCESPIRDATVLVAIMERLLGQVLQQLERCGQALRRLDCVLVREGAAPTRLSVSLSRPSRHWAHIAGLLRERLEPLDLAAGICGLSLVVRQAAPWRPGQAELFESRPPGQDERLGTLLDRVAARLGDEAVVRPQLVDDYQPERAFRYVPVSESGLAPSEQSGGCAVPSGFTSVGPRPVRLLSRPIPIRVMALVPDGPPAWFAYRGRDHVIVASVGPERVATGWWRGTDLRRDYFRVTTESGEQFWIFYSPAERRWYLHGIFA